MFEFTPATKDKFRRFRHMKRAWISMWILLILFVLSLMSELIAHGTPWMVRFEGNTYFPRIQNVTRDTFFHDGVLTPPDFHELQTLEDYFGTSTNNWMLWAPIRFSPEDTIPPEQIELDEVLEVGVRRVQRVSELRVSSRGAIRKGRNLDWFENKGVESFPLTLQDAIDRRFTNEASPEKTVLSPTEAFEWRLSAYEPRSRPPRSVRILVRERLPDEETSLTAILPVGSADRPEWWTSLPESVQAQAEQHLQEALTVPVEGIIFTDSENTLREVTIEKETVQYPFRPVKHHPLGLDHSGRDVLVLILYATRIGLLFGFTLVFFTMLIGTFLGGIQGYFGGRVDMIAQRVIEIYSSIPFLYAMIFLGSVFGRSFGLLLGVYAAFNWISISFYMRAEFLRLRRQPFTEAAKSLGLSTPRVMWKHLLPNAMIPIITFFPFSLVGAIGSLSALDYLGFGLPVGTPSWGDLLRQGQEYRYAWWLILYPSIMLFTVILLSVFIGEGLRSAFDPKRETQWDA